MCGETYDLNDVGGLLVGSQSERNRHVVRDTRVVDYRKFQDSQSVVAVWDARLKVDKLTENTDLNQLDSRFKLLE